MMRWPGHPDPVTFTPAYRGVAQGILLSLLTAAAAGENAPAIRLDGNTLHTPRHEITLGADGLPQQIVLLAAPAELPLEWRGKAAEVPQAILAELGRGSQLSQPMRWTVRADGQDLVAQPVRPLQLEMKGERVVAEAQLKAGLCPLSLACAYAPSGRMDFRLTYGDGGQAVESLTLAIALAGPIDIAVLGPPIDDPLRLYRLEEFSLRPDAGTAWANTGSARPEGGRDSPGVPPRCFLGSGDRGFTWLAQRADGFHIPPASPCLEVERDKAGLLTWLVHVVQQEARLEKPETAEFSILVHPAGARPPGSRIAVWTSPDETWPRADRAVDEPEGSAFMALEGPAGGDALSAEENLAVTFPLAFHRFLAGTQTGLAARLRTNANRLIRPGMNPAADRMALGRTLLLDIGLDPSDLAHRTEAASVIRAMDEFGCFLDDGQTEFIPYWRSPAFLGYGEAFNSGGAFSLTHEDPLAHVHISLWRRPMATGIGGSKGFKALIAVVNESAAAVREQLYLLDRIRLLGGPNQIHAKAVIAGWDFSAIPDDSDWSRARLQATVSSHGGGNASDVSLLDTADHGFVRLAATKDSLEVYGPLHVPAYSFRLLLAAGP
ncbi:MAG: hypothetical protein HYU36_05620 [Planctomycetes bacterium]|nr:hypothetical protein [Planctomycetota bacterium]